ncbi:OmpP1/FadL family transporter [Leptospira inadai]|nr:transporter [Leptospira inadai serovar Lyme]
MRMIIRITITKIIPTFNKGTASRFLLLNILFWKVSPIIGFQGIMQTSFGARQAGMGGAFQGVGGSVMDLESNPSHLARLAGPKFEIGTSGHFPKIKYSDSFMDQSSALIYENNINESPRAIFPYIGYIAPVSSRLGVGVALYSQGGGGGSFSNITRISQGKESLNDTLRANVPLLGTDRKVKEDLEFKFMLSKLTFGSGYRFRKLCLGIGIDLVYAFMEMKKTNQDMSRSLRLPGSLAYSSDPSYAFSGKLGLSYELTDVIRVAYSYTARSVLHLDGTMKIEDVNPIIQNVSRVSRNMIWPDRHVFGISYHKSSWIFDLDIKFIPWSQSFRTSKFALEQPLLTTPIGTETNTMLMNFRWRDQYCFAFGMEYQWNYGIRLRSGYSYAKTPTTPQGLNPMLGTTNEHHLAGGIGYYAENSAIHFAIEYGFPKTIKGSEFSDWSLAHSVFSKNEIQLYQFQFAKSVSVLSMYLGFEKNI